jgi:CheY-like chemotaxis protein
MSAPAILLVEDDPHSVFFFEHSMKRLALANPLAVATDGRMAMDYLEGAGEFSDRQKHPLPGLMLLDLKLPHLSGFEVLRQLRRRPETATLIVLVLTSSASDEDIAQAYAAGANGYLVKPSRLEDLEELVGAIKVFWLTHNHPPPGPG